MPAVYDELMGQTEIEQAYMQELESGGQAPVGISPAVASALLRLNPQLREQGHTTASLVAGSQQAGHGKATTKKAAAPASVVGAFEHFENVKKRVEQAEGLAQKRAAEAQQALRASLEEELKLFERWLLSNDADLRSPITQEAIERYSVLLQKLGFTVKGYVNRHRQRA